MKKRIPIIIALVVGAMAVSAAFVSCGDKDEKPSDSGHEHSPASSWTSDETYHWHACTFSGCTFMLFRETHGFVPTTVDGDEIERCYKCGYTKETGEKDPEDPPPVTPTPDTGDSAFGGVAVSKGGVLSWNKIKGASKYVITVTYSGNSVPTKYDVDKSKTSQDLSALRSEGFPVGKSQVTIEAYGIQSETIGGETVETELPMTGVQDSLQVTKLNGEYTFTRLKYVDKYVTLDGFYSDKVTGSDGKQYYLYELALENNQNTQLNLVNKVRPATNASVAFYKSESDRQNETGAYSSLEVRILRFAHGENKLYARVTADGATHDYDLCVYGLYTVNVERLSATLDADGDGYRVYNNQAIGLPISLTERDILPQSTLYDGVQSGAIGRTSDYSVIEKTDYVFTLPKSFNASQPYMIYFYDETTLRADCAEYAEYAKYFAISDNVNGNNMTLSTSGSMITGAVVVPHTIAGKRISGASFFMSDATSVEIEEGFTEFVATFNYCTKLTDIWLPSTISYMGERALGNNSLDTLPQSLTIHCAFDSSHASAFHYNWNGIAGTTKKFNTVYGDTAPVTVGGISYRIENGELTVIGVGNGFDGVIPETATVRRREYNVAAIARIDYDGDITIGKNITYIYDGAFTSAVGKITVDGNNNYFTVQNGLLYANGTSRIVVAQKDFSEAEIDGSVYAIDKNAFTGCNGGALYFATQYDNFGNWDKSDINAVFGVAQVVTENGFKVLIKTNDTAVIAAYVGSGNVTDLIIPSTAAGHEVTSVLSGLLKSCTAVKTLTVPFVGEAKDGSGRTDIKCLFGDSVPSTLTSVKVSGGAVAADAFDDCLSVRSITLGDEVTQVMRGAFDDCANLQYNESGNGCYIGTESNDYYLFVKPKSANITSLTVNAQTKIILRGALEGCNNIESLNIPFIGCTSNDENGTLGDIFCDTVIHEYGEKCNEFVPQSLKAVEFNGSAYAGAFTGCNNIQRIVIGAGVENIASEAFGVGNTKMTSLAVIESDGNSRYTVNSGILYGESGSRILFVPRAISGEITIGDSITEIDANTFMGCTKITAITVPETVTSIGQNAFSGCTGLRSLTLPFVGKTADADGDEARLAYVLGSSGNEYLSNLTITGGTKARGIGDALSSKSNHLQTLVLPATLTELGGYTLIGCEYLRSITVPFVGATGSVPSDVDPKQFGCIFGFKYTGGKNEPNVPSTLESITILNGTEINETYFKNCGSVKTLILPDECTSVNINNRINNLTGLQYKEYDNGKYFDSVSTPYYMLYGVKDKNATTLRVHESTRILANASDCKIENVVFDGENVTHIGTQALAFTNIAEIVIPDSVEYLGWGALGDCKYLKSVTIGLNVKYISGNLLEHWNEQYMEVTSVIFKNPNGWSVNGQALSADTLSDPQQAAQYLMTCWGSDKELTRE